LPPLDRPWGEVLAPGTIREWYVLSVDPVKRRISLTLPGEGPAGTVEAGAVLRGRVQRLERFGVFLWLAPGRVGLIPRAWTGATSDDDLRRRFAHGTEVEARVVECDEEGRRLRLAPPGFDATERPAAAPRARAPKPQREPAAPTGSGFGSILADKLREALHKR
jgi:predicted RNA-binding protein with RPS1 domain